MSVYDMGVLAHLDDTIGGCGFGGRLYYDVKAPSNAPTDVPTTSPTTQPTNTPTKEPSTVGGPGGQVEEQENG